STLSSRAICGSALRARLYGITEVREITRNALICPRVAMSSSVIPSAKYSCELSPDRFSSGRTASERIGTSCGALDRRAQATTTIDARASATPMIVHGYQRRERRGDAGTATGATD